MLINFRAARGQTFVEENNFNDRVERNRFDVNAKAGIRALALDILVVAVADLIFGDLLSLRDHRGSRKFVRYVPKQSAQWRCVDCEKNVGKIVSSWSFCMDIGRFIWGCRQITHELLVRVRLVNILEIIGVKTERHVEPNVGVFPEDLRRHLFETFQLIYAHNVPRVRLPVAAEVYLIQDLKIIVSRKAFQSKRRFNSFVFCLFVYLRFLH